MKYSGPKAGLSPDGRRVAVTVRSGEIALHDLTSGAETRVRVEMNDVTSLSIRDDGTVDAGTATPDWAFYRVSRSGGVLKIDARAACYATSRDGSRTYSAQDSRLTEWDDRGEQVSARRILGGAKGSPVIVTERSVYVRTALGIFQRFRRPLLT